MSSTLSQPNTQQHTQPHVQPTSQPTNLMDNPKSRTPHTNPLNSQITYAQSEHPPHRQPDTHKHDQPASLPTKRTRTDTYTTDQPTTHGQPHNQSFNQPANFTDTRPRTTRQPIARTIHKPAQSHTQPTKQSHTQTTKPARMQHQPPKPTSTRPMTHQRASRTTTHLRSQPPQHTTHHRAKPQSQPHPPCQPCAHANTRLASQSHHQHAKQRKHSCSQSSIHTKSNTRAGERPTHARVIAHSTTSVAGISRQANMTYDHAHTHARPAKPSIHQTKGESNGPIKCTTQTTYRNTNSQPAQHTINQCVNGGRQSTKYTHARTQSTTRTTNQ